MRLSLKTTFEYQIGHYFRLTEMHWQIFASPIKDAIPYQAGQYVLVKYPQGNFFPFSIANAPNEAHQIELHIRTNPDDEMTENFLETAMAQKKITLAGPFGECQYQEESGPLLLLAAGTGFAPAKAIIEDIINHRKNRPCYLYWTVRKPEDFYLPKLPEYFQRVLTDFHYIPICTRMQASHYQNNILEAVLSDFDSLISCQVYVFGPRPLAIEALNVFVNNGVRREHFFADVLSRKEILQEIKLGGS